MAEKSKLEVINIPFSGYPTFAACVSDQMRKHKGEKGFTIDNARRICGFLEKRSKQKHMEDVKVYSEKDLGIETIETK